MQTPRIKRRERDTIIQALRAGVVPRLGLQHIQVGRVREIEELVRDVERIGEGGAAIRFVIGEYGLRQDILSEPDPLGRASRREWSCCRRIWRRTGVCMPPGGKRVLCMRR